MPQEMAKKFNYNLIDEFRTCVAGALPALLEKYHEAGYTVHSKFLGFTPLDIATDAKNTSVATALYLNHDAPFGNKTISALFHAVIGNGDLAAFEELIRSDKSECAHYYQPNRSLLLDVAIHTYQSAERQNPNETTEISDNRLKIRNILAESLGKGFESCLLEEPAALPHASGTKHRESGEGVTFRG